MITAREVKREDDRNGHIDAKDCAKMQLKIKN